MKPKINREVLFNGKRKYLSHCLILIILPLLISFSLLSCGRGKDEVLKIGDSAPDFTLMSLDGDEINLSAYRGLPVILRFFLTDCKYCRADTPVFNTYFTRYRSQGLQIFYLDPLSIDRTILAAFQEKLMVRFPILLDKGGKVAEKYKVKALPQTIILSPQHTIIAAILGSVSEEELNRTLSPYIHAEEE
jgi:peroxiredoxin